MAQKRAVTLPSHRILQALTADFLKLKWDVQLLIRYKKVAGMVQQQAYDLSSHKTG